MKSLSKQNNFTKFQSFIDFSTLCFTSELSGFGVISMTLQGVPLSNANRAAVAAAARGRDLMAFWSVVSRILHPLNVT